MGAKVRGNVMSAPRIADTVPVIVMQGRAHLVPDAATSGSPQGHPPCCITCGLRAPLGLHNSVEGLTGLRKPYTHGCGVLQRDDIESNRPRKRHMDRVQEGSWRGAASCLVPVRWWAVPAAPGNKHGESVASRGSSPEPRCQSFYRAWSCRPG